MASRVQVWCNSAIEAGWLLALLLTPLFFNMYSNRTFEPDKALLLRSLALAVLCLWSIKGIDWLLHRRTRRGRGNGSEEGRWRTLRRLAHPLVAPVVLVGVSYVVSTAWSVHGTISFFGSYERGQGLYTAGSYLVLGASAAALLRTRAQGERFVSVALLAGLAVAGYGILERAGLLPWELELDRIVATAGNSIFAAAFLILTVPFTLYRLVPRLRVVRGDVTPSFAYGGGAAFVVAGTAAWLVHVAAGAAVAGGGGALVAWLLARRGVQRERAVQVVGYLVLLAIQLAALFMTKSRGPLLGLAVGVGCFAVVYALVRGRRSLARWVLGGGVLGVLFLVSLNVAGPDRLPVGEGSYLGRLSQVVESNTSRVRMLIWEGTAELVSSDAERAFVGYGPETMLFVYPPHYPAALNKLEWPMNMPDRAHNVFFDVLASRGLVGLGAYLWFVVALLYYALVQTGIAASRSQRRGLLAALLGGGLGGVGLAVLVDHSLRFAGPALGAGIVVGLFAFLAGRAFGGASRSKDHTVGEPGPLFVCAVLAVLVAHLAELQVGIAVVSTQVVLWIGAGVLVGLQLQKEGAAGEAAPARDDVAEVPFRWGELALFVGIGIVTLVHGLVVPFAAGSGAVTVLVLGAVLLGGGWFLGVDEGPGRQRASAEQRGFTRYAIAVLAIAGGYAVVRAGLLAGGGDGYAGLVVLYYVSALLFLLVYATVQATPSASKGRSRGIGGAGWLLPLAPIVLAGWGVSINVDHVRADVMAREARKQAASQRPERMTSAAELYGRAHEKAPHRSVYLSRQGEVLDLLARRAEEPSAREAHFRSALDVLHAAQEMEPLHASYMVMLAQVYGNWGWYAEDDEVQEALLEEASTWSERAVQRSPHKPSGWDMWGRVLEVRGAVDRAEEKYRRAIALDDADPGPYRRLAGMLAGHGRKEAAVHVYEEAVAHTDEDAQMLQTLATLYRELERFEDAIRTYERLVEEAPEDVDVHQALMELYAEVGRCEAAERQGERLLAAATEQRGAYRFMIRRAQQTCTRNGSAEAVQ